VARAATAAGQVLRRTAANKLREWQDVAPQSSESRGKLEQD